jgi:Rv0078B-related antitoxin
LGTKWKTKSKVDPIYRDKVLAARKMSVGERIASGIELFEGAVGMMRDRLCGQFPELSPNKVEELLVKRLKRLRQIQEHGLFHTTKP